MASKGVKVKRLECPVCKRMIPMSNLPIHLRNKHPEEPFFYNRNTKTIDKKTVIKPKNVKNNLNIITDPEVQINKNADVIASETTDSFIENGEYEMENNDEKLPVIKKTKPQPVKKYIPPVNNEDDDDEYFYLNL